jgi:hypothetical protein
MAFAFRLAYPQTASLLSDTIQVRKPHADCLFPHCRRRKATGEATHVIPFKDFEDSQNMKLPGIWWLDEQETWSQVSAELVQLANAECVPVVEPPQQRDLGNGK